MLISIIQPRGTHLVRRRYSCVGRWIVTFLMVGGIVSLFHASSVEATANGLSYQVQYEDDIPEDIRTYCELVGTEFTICPELLEAMAYNESRFIPTVTNGNYYGLMQIDVKIHAKRIAKYGWTTEDMLDPYKNLIVAGDLLHELYETYGDENPIVLAYYSGNSRTIKTYLRTGKMCSYAETILERSAEYERIHGK